jgi:hypothetical protein
MFLILVNTGVRSKYREFKNIVCRTRNGKKKPKPKEKTWCQRGWPSVQLTIHNFTVTASEVTV